MTTDIIKKTPPVLQQFPLANSQQSALHFTYRVIWITFSCTLKRYCFCLKLNSLFLKTITQKTEVVKLVPAACFYNDSFQRISYSSKLQQEKIHIVLGDIRSFVSLSQYFCKTFNDFKLNFKLKFILVKFILISTQKFLNVSKKQFTLEFPIKLI